MNDRALLSSLPHGAIHSDPLGDRGSDSLAAVSVWNGILHEFRNHLTVIMAAEHIYRNALA